MNDRRGIRGSVISLQSGDPSVKGLVKWPAYDPLTDNYLNFKIPLQMETEFSVYLCAGTELNTTWWQ